MEKGLRGKKRTKEDKKSPVMTSPMCSRQKITTEEMNWLLSIWKRQLTRLGLAIGVDENDVKK